MKNKRLVPYIPSTKRFSQNTLNKMLGRYKMVYLKPVHGLKGRGIMRARKKGTKYELRKGTSAAVFTNVQTLYQSVRRKIRRESYLVQKGIRALRYHSRPFDFRIMVQKNEEREWEVSGIVGRVAPPKRIVTNRSQGGKCLPAERLLLSYINKSKIKSYLKSLFRLSRSIGRQFQKDYPKAWQLGVDIAVSHDLKPWVLEVNTNPAVTPFIKLRNRRMRNRIIQLIRHNRRRPAKSQQHLKKKPTHASVSARFTENYGNNPQLVFLRLPVLNRYTGRLHPLSK
jgi:hypothetical protein